MQPNIGEWFPLQTGSNEVINNAGLVQITQVCRTGDSSASLLTTTGTRGVLQTHYEYLKDVEVTLVLMNKASTSYTARITPKE